MFVIHVLGKCVLLHEERQTEFNELVDLNSKTQTQTLGACHCVLFYRHFNVVHIIKSGLIAFILCHCSTPSSCKCFFFFFYGLNRTGIPLITDSI